MPWLYEPWTSSGYNAIYVHMHMHMYRYIYIYIERDRYVYIYIYIDIHIHILYVVYYVCIQPSSPAAKILHTPALCPSPFKEL